MSATGYATRLSVGEQWEQDLRAKLEAEGLQVIPLADKTLEAHQALSALREPGETARFIRYMPDGAAVEVERQDAYFFDAKAGNSIEKDAYLAYLAFAGERRRCDIYVRRPSGDVYRVPARKLVLIPAEVSVAPFPPDRQMPIEDGWLAPRRWPREKYLRWKAGNQQASGTAFRYIDFAALGQYRLGK
jgi:hypothetical protein